MKVLLFSNPGCGSCKTWRPVFTGLMEKYHLEFDVIDMYSPINKELVKKYDVHGIPYTIFLSDDGKKLGDILGNMNEELADRDISYYISLDKKDDGIRTA